MYCKLFKIFERGSVKQVEPVTDLHSMWMSRAAWGQTRAQTLSLILTRLRQGIEILCLELCWVKVKRNIFRRFNLNIICPAFVCCSGRYWLKVQSKKCISDTHRTLSRWDRRFYQADSRKRCRSTTLELSFDNLHTLISNLHISGTGGNLIRLVVLQEHTPVLRFSFWLKSKPCVGEELWLICRFGLFGTFSASAWGEMKGRDSIRIAITHARGGMNVCMCWDLDTRKALARCWGGPPELVWQVVILSTVNLFYPQDVTRPL